MSWKYVFAQITIICTINLISGLLLEFTRWSMKRKCDSSPSSSSHFQLCGWLWLPGVRAWGHFNNTFNVKQQLHQCKFLCILHIINLQCVTAYTKIGMQTIMENMRVCERKVHIVWEGQFFLLNRLVNELRFRSLLSLQYSVPRIYMYVTCFYSSL